MLPAAAVVPSDLVFGFEQPIRPVIVPKDFPSRVVVVKVQSPAKSTGSSPALIAATTTATLKSVPVKPKKVAAVKKTSIVVTTTPKRPKQSSVAKKTMFVPAMSTPPVAAAKCIVVSDDNYVEEDDDTYVTSDVSDDEISSDTDESPTSSVDVEYSDQDAFGFPLMSVVYDSQDHIADDGKMKVDDSSSSVSVSPEDTNTQLAGPVGSFLDAIAAIVKRSRRTPVDPKAFETFAQVSKHACQSTNKDRTIADNDHLVELVAKTTSVVLSKTTNVFLATSCQKDPQSLLKYIYDFPRRRKFAVDTAFGVFSLINIIQQTLLVIWHATGDKSVMDIFYQLGIHYRPLASVMTVAVALECNELDYGYDEIASHLPKWCFYAPKSARGLVCIALADHAERLSSSTCTNTTLSLGDSDFSAAAASLKESGYEAASINPADGNSTFCMFGRTNMSFDIRRSVIFDTDNVLSSQGDISNVFDDIHSLDHATFAKSVAYQQDIVLTSCTAPEGTVVLSTIPAPRGVFGWIKSHFTDIYAQVVDYSVARPFWNTLPLSSSSSVFPMTPNRFDSPGNDHCDMLARLDHFLLDAIYISHFSNYRQVETSVDIFNTPQRDGDGNGAGGGTNKSWAQTCGMIDEHAIALTTLQTRATAALQGMIQRGYYDGIDIATTLAPPSASLCFLGIAPGVALFSSSREIQQVESDILSANGAGKHSLQTAVAGEFADVMGKIALEACVRRLDQICTIRHLVTGP